MASNTIDVPLYNLRDVTPPDMQHMGWRRMVGSIQQIWFADHELDTDQNLRRSYLEAGRKTAIDKKQQHTLSDRPYLFSTLNGGLTICTTEAQTIRRTKDGKADVTLIRLSDAALTDGAQTQGNLRLMALASQENSDADAMKATYVTAELLVVERDMISFICETRNSRTPVKQISILGGKGVFTPIEESFNARMAAEGRELRLQTSESDFVGFADTKLLIAATFAIMPREVNGAVNNWSYRYKGIALGRLDELFDNAKKAPDSSDGRAYRFFVDMAADVYLLFERLRKPLPGIARVIDEALPPNKRKTAGSGRGRRRADTYQNYEVGAGVIFAMLAGYRHFVHQIDGRWTLQIPQSWIDNWESEYYEEAANILKRHKGARMPAHDMGQIAQSSEDLFRWVRTVLRRSPSGAAAHEYQPSI